MTSGKGTAIVPRYPETGIPRPASRVCTRPSSLRQQQTRRHTFDEAPLPDRLLGDAGHFGQPRAARAAERQCIAREQHVVPAAHQDAEVVRAFREQAVGVDELATRRFARANVGTQQRVVFVTVAVHEHAVGGVVRAFPQRRITERAVEYGLGTRVSVQGSRGRDDELRKPARLFGTGHQTVAVVQRDPRGLQRRADEFDLCARRQAQLRKGPAEALEQDRVTRFVMRQQGCIAATGGDAIGARFAREIRRAG